VATAIEQLLVLQACDQEIRRLRREMQDIPRRQEQIEMRLTVQKENVERAEALLREKQAHIRNLAQESEAAREHIRKLRGQQLEIKTNEAYKALEREIATTMGKIRELEDQELETMEEAEAAKEELAGRRDALARESEGVDEELKVFAARSEGLGDELKAKEEERRTRAEGIDPAWLSRYERLFAKQGDMAIALVERDTCGGCHMKLTPSQIVSARRSDTLTLCDFCGRMLYLDS
jgi:predicted  nucleic acid-binding Zn-ribbon protein